MLTFKIIECKTCKLEFRQKRKAQVYCSDYCRNVGWKKPNKQRLPRSVAKEQKVPLWAPLRGSVAKRQKNTTKTIICKHPSTPDLGAFVREQIVAQQDQPNPIRFTTPEGVKGRVWLASDKNGKRIIGDDWHWRLNVPAASRVDHDARSKRVTATLADIWQTELDFPPMGFRARICIEAEKELQVLGCGWRIVTCQFRSNNVVLHHNDHNATMKRADFKRFIANNRACRWKGGADATPR